MTRAPTSAASVNALYRAAGDALTTGRYEEGITLLEKLLVLAPSSKIHNNLGTANWKCSRLAKAEEHYAAAVRLDPRNAVALNNYGGLLMEQLRLDEAEKLLKSAQALKAAHPSIANNMGLLHVRRGDFAAAEKCFRAAITTRPRWSDPYANLGDIYQETHREREAETQYKKALLLDAGNAAAWKSLGSLLFNLRRNAEAEEALRRALALRPRSEATWSLLLQQFELMSRLDDATKTAEEARKYFPRSPYIITVWARLQRRKGNVAAGIVEMEKMAADLGPKASSAGIPFFNELGHLYDYAGDAARAFECFTRSNALQATQPEAKMIDKTAMSAVASRLEKELTPALAKRFPAPAPEDRPVPVFLIGFPRSGTTLLDQILSGHPGVHVAEENPAVTIMGDYFRRWYERKTGAQPDNRGDVWKTPGYPSAIPDLAAEDIAALREVFWREHKVDDVLGDRLFVDKLPANALHAAFIHAVFPNSKFILALRHPCDCVLSCYMQNFGLNPTMIRFLDLEDGARFYDEMFRVVEQTRKILPLDIHRVHYEDVVGDFRRTVSSLLSFLGLPWHDAVLDYDQTAKAKGRINTPSYHQVTQKIYTRASGRWYRYRKHLEPVLGILAPWIERYGYSMDPPDKAE